ncbi:MAG: glycosyltransferase family 4 protein [Anaerovoracaceae bacterium]
MRIWILNHYATDMFFDGTGRHQALGKYLVRSGHEVKIFCANTVHNSDIVVDTGGYNAKEEMGPDGVPYIFIKTKPYKGNGIGRIRNMVQFWKNVKKAVKNKVKEDGKPDIILASSVHPLTLVAGIQIKKKLNIPCVCEIRDLWPETFVSLGKMRRGSLLVRLMYEGEHWIYKKADKLVFTMPGGEEYIKDQKWAGDVELEKVHHINNGVDLEQFYENRKNYKISDEDLENDNTFKIIYAGSIREVNRVNELVSAAEILRKKHIDNVKIIVFGDGTQRKQLEGKSKKLNLNNIVFKGRVDKKYIPYILSRGDLNMVTVDNNDLGRYGISWNKMFEYMASGKPTIVNYDMGKYNLVSDYDFGIAKKYASVEELCDDIILLLKLTCDEYNKLSQNALVAAKEYDYRELADKLEYILEVAINDYKSNRRGRE